MERKSWEPSEPTYLINEEGIIEKAFGKVKPGENPAQMLGEL